MKQNHLKELMTALLMLCCTVASAQDFEVDGLYYNILSSEDKTVELTGGSPSGELVIPSTVTYESVDYTVTEVAEIAFQFNKTMTSVTIPATIEYIRSAAFSDCSNVTAFNVAADNATYVSENGVIYTKDMSTIILCPNTTTGVYKIRANVSTIGECAFDGCTKIEKIIIPQSVSTIGQYAFANCELLTELTIPASVTSIDDYAFEDCTGLTSIVVDEGNSVYDSRGNCNAIIETASNTLITASKNTIIPEGVTSISDRAFYNCSGLTSIVIPNSVTSIDRCAFEGCTGLTSVEIPSSVTSIGYWAFCRCSGLTSIVIPSSVTSIGNYAFNDCTGLTSIVSHIAAEDLFAPGDYAFNGIDKDACTLYVPVGAKSTYAATDGWKEFTNIVEANGKCGDNAYWTLNEGVLTIFGEGAMYNYADDDANRAPWYSNKENITSVTIEEGVTSIGNYAFYDCDGLTSIEIPSSVTNIGDKAFYGCWNLTSIVVDEGNTIYDSRGNCNAIIETASNTLIAGCKNTIIPSSVTSIGNSAFGSCNGLTSIEIPSSVTSIGEWAFRGCSGLTSIEIPSSVTSIGESAFGGCSGLTSIVVDEGNSVYDSRGNCNAIIETASNTLIAGCKNTIIPEGVTSIGNSAFVGCNGLTSIEIPSSVTSIGEEAFAYCYGLTSIEIPSSVTSIGYEAFTYCNGLTSIKIPEGVTSIGNEAFCNCIGLTSIEIPSSVTSIGNGAFYLCNSLRSIVSHIAAEDLFAPGDNAFGKIDKDACTLYVPAGAKSTYAATEQWKDFTNIVEFNGKCGDNAYWALNEGVLTIFGTGAMYNYADNDANRAPWYADRENISSVSIGSGITVIGEWALAGCLFTSIEFPNTLTTIKEEALSDCSALTSITIPASVTTIEDYAFACKSLATITVEAGNTTYDSRNNCNAIIETATNKLIAGSANAVIPEGITTIGTYAFDNIDIKNLEIPASVTSIEEGAFLYTSLKSVKLPNTITTIERFIFQRSKIETIEIPASVTSIGDWAFQGCTGLTSIDIPSSVTSIGEGAFNWCTGITSIVSHIAAEDLFAPGDYAFDEIDKNACTLYVPAGAKSTYAATDGWKDFTNIVEPNGKCGDNAYWALNEETGALTIFGTGAMYDYAAFDDANRAPWYADRENITSVTIEEGVTSIGNSAFWECPDLTSIEIPSSVTSIGAWAFSRCYNLTSIEIPSSVTSIGFEAFSNCHDLTSIEIPSSVTSIGDGAFSICRSLTSIVVDEGNTIYDSRGNCNAIIETASNTLIRGCKNTIIPSSVTSIGARAFNYCDNLTSIEIPSSVTSIGNDAFYGCYDLKSIEIPSSVTSIGNDAFSACWSLTSIVVDEGNTIYDSRGNCNAIIETASNTLIRGCKNTIIPEGITSIGESAFIWCTGLTSIEIPSSVTSIGYEAFSHCYGLTSIEIPEGVTSIGGWAFWSCEDLTSIVSHIAAEDLFAPGGDAFNNVDKTNCTLYVPAGAKSTYAATEQWKDFKNIVETYDLTVTAAGYATLYLGTAVEIPAGVEAYTANRIEGDRLKMQAVEDVIPANTAVIIKAEEGTYSFAYSDETPDAIEGNLLRGTLIDTYIKPASAQTAYVLSKVDGIVGMYRAKLKADGTFKNNANRVYMLLGDINVGEGDLDTSNPGGQLSNGYRFDFSGTTAIESVETESTAPAVYYDLSGRRVENPTKGIYIVNGRKVFIK